VDDTRSGCIWPAGRRLAQQKRGALAPLYVAPIRPPPERNTPADENESVIRSESSLRLLIDLFGLNSLRRDHGRRMPVR
jgi:hypothetical protein